MLSQVSAAGVLDYEAKSEYNMSVRVTDDGSPPKSLDKTITILVDDVNEAPSDLQLDADTVRGCELLYGRKLTGQEDKSKQQTNQKTKQIC